MLLSSITSSTSKIFSSCMPSTPLDMSTRSNSSMLPPPPSSSSSTGSSSTSTSFPLSGHSCCSHLHNFVSLVVAIWQSSRFELNRVAVSVSILCLPNRARERLWARLAAFMADFLLYKYARYGLGVLYNTVVWYRNYTSTLIATSQWTSGNYRATIWSVFGNKVAVCPLRLWWQTDHFLAKSWNHRLPPLTRGGYPGPAVQVMTPLSSCVDVTIYERLHILMLLQMHAMQGEGPPGLWPRYLQETARARFHLTICSLHPPCI